MNAGLQGQGTHKTNHGCIMHKEAARCCCKDFAQRMGWLAVQ
jgi:hypothetical protein